MDGGWREDLVGGWGGGGGREALEEFRGSVGRISSTREDAAGSALHSDPVDCVQKKMPFCCCIRKH